MSTAPAPVRPRIAHERLTQFLLVTLVVLAAIAVLVLARNLSGDGSSAGTEGSGVAASETRSLPPFTSVHLAGSNNVTVRVGNAHEVVVHADDNLIDHVTTKVSDGELVVAETGDFKAKSPMSVDVAVPALDEVMLSGSGIVTVEGVDADAFVVRAPGSGIVAARGTARWLDASLDGSGDLQLQDLVARDAKASVSGSGRLQVHATQTLDASISGSGAIFYSGGPQVAQSVSGSGVIMGQ